MGVSRNQCYKLNKNGKRCKLKCMDDCDTCHIHHITFSEDNDDYIYELIDDMQNDIQSMENKLNNYIQKMNDMKKEMRFQITFYKFVTVLLCASNAFLMVKTHIEQDDNSHTIDYIKSSLSNITFDFERCLSYMKF